MFEKAFEMQRIKEDKLRQLQMEALIRERNALSSCAVEFKMQMRMAEDNMKEYGEQVDELFLVNYEKLMHPVNLFVNFHLKCLMA